MDKEQNRIMAIFFRDTFGELDTKFMASGVDLYRWFYVWVKANPLGTKHKYAAFFPSYCTKRLFKEFLDVVLGIRRSNKHHKYWIKTKDEAVKINSLIRSLTVS